jgi:hypothetical protein
MKHKNLAERLAEKFEGKAELMIGSPNSGIFRAQVRMSTRPDIDDTLEILEGYYKAHGFKKNGSVMTFKNDKGQHRYSTIHYYENHLRLVVEGREY